MFDQLEPSHSTTASDVFVPSTEISAIAKRRFVLAASARTPWSTTLPLTLASRVQSVPFQRATGLVTAVGLVIAPAATTVLLKTAIAFTGKSTPLPNPNQFVPFQRATCVAEMPSTLRKFPPT